MERAGSMASELDGMASRKEYWTGGFRNDPLSLSFVEVHQQAHAGISSHVMC